MLTRYLKPTPDNPKHAGYAGAVAQVWQDGKPRFTVTVGHCQQPIRICPGQTYWWAERGPW